MGNEEDFHMGAVETLKSSFGVHVDIVGRIVQDKTEMAEQIASLMRNQSQWAKESCKCLAYYAQHHLPEATYSKYERVIGELLGPEIPKSPNGENREL